MTQLELDTALDRIHTIPVVISPAAPLPPDNDVYDAIRDIHQTGFTITPRELLHAIGSKTAALPSSASDECLRVSLLYTYVLDLDSQYLRFNAMNSDLQTPRSQELGIGITCLLAGKAFGVPWDQLGALPGPGLRFDYRGKIDGFDGIFESKGTSHRGNQASQIKSGLEKKAAHHGRGEKFDAELIISTFVGRGDDAPRIVVGDPDFSELEDLYDKADNRFFRLRHYSRILQFIGLPKSAYHLNRHALAYLRGEIDVDRIILDEKQNAGYLTVESFGRHLYFGRWFEEVLPKKSKRYNRERFRSLIHEVSAESGRRKVFQGLRSDVYQAGLSGEPFTQNLLSRTEVEKTVEESAIPISVFSDGTIQVFKQI